MNWVGFGIAFGLLAIIPVWVIRIFEMGFFTKVFLTAVLGVITFIAIQYGGVKRGFVSRR